MRSVTNAKDKYIIINWQINFRISPVSIYTENWKMSLFGRDEGRGTGDEGQGTGDGGLQISDIGFRISNINSCFRHFSKKSFFLL